MLFFYTSSRQEILAPLNIWIGRSYFKLYKISKKSLLIDTGDISSGTLPRDPISRGIRGDHELARAILLILEATY